MVSARGQNLRVVPVPWVASDLTTPHQAYNGHATTFKAIARSDGPGPFVYEWDFQGDGTYDFISSTANGYNLSTRFTFPNQAVTTTFNASIRVTANGQTVTGVYPVRVFADVPPQTNSSNNGTAQPQSATAPQLEVMRAVAVDDALWYMHLSMNRTGSGAAISGNFAGASPQLSTATTSAFVLAAVRNGHYPAYPPGTYDQNINPGVWFRPPIPPAFIVANDSRYQNDPYAETVLRALNSLLSGLTIQTGIPPFDEGDDSSPPIPDTNDGAGLLTVDDMRWGAEGLPLAAIAESGLTGTVAQTGNMTFVRGRSIEYIAQQMVDWNTFAQLDIGATTGGWTYSPFVTTGAVTGDDIFRGATIGLKSVIDNMQTAGVHVNQRLLSRIPSFIKYNIDPTSHLARYFPNACTGAGNFAETGDVLFGAGALLGWNTFDPADTTVLAPDYAMLPITKGEARQMFDAFIGAVTANWTSWQRDCNLVASGLFYNDGGTNATPYLRTDSRGNMLAQFAFANALSNLSNKQDYAVLGTHDWKREMSTYLIRNQFIDGHWNDTEWSSDGPQWSYLYYGPLLNTAYGVLTIGDVPAQPANTPPSAQNDSYSTAESTALDVTAPGVLSNDTDSDGNALTAIVVTPPAHGTLTLNANGSFLYTPENEFDGTDTFTYKANDGTDNSIPATVTITVTEVSTPPTNVTATAISPTSIRVTWTAAVDATEYEVLRSSDGINFDHVEYVTGTMYDELNLSENTAFLYTVRASQPDLSVQADPDLAVTVIYTNEPLVAGTTGLAFNHIDELRRAIVAVWTLAGQDGAPFTTDPVLSPDDPIRFQHFGEVRTSLNIARDALSLPVATFTNPPPAAGALFDADDVSDLRGWMR